MTPDLGYYYYYWKGARRVNSSARTIRGMKQKNKVPHHTIGTSTKQTPSKTHDQTFRSASFCCTSNLVFGSTKETKEQHADVEVW